MSWFWGGEDTIEEANRHIEALTKRNFQLEEQLQELSEANRKQNKAHAESLAVLPLRMNQTLKAKDEQIQELKAEVARLKVEANEREMLMEHLRNRSKILDEVMKHRDALETVLACLDIVQEPDYDADEEYEESYSKTERETDLLNDSDAENVEKNKPSRIDSGIEVEGSSNNEKSLTTH